MENRERPSTLIILNSVSRLQCVNSNISMFKLLCSQDFDGHETKRKIRGDITSSRNIVVQRNICNTSLVQSVKG